MALKLSTGAKNGLATTQGLKEIFEGGYIDLYSGAQPTSPDYAESGTKLARITLASGGLTTSGLTFGTAASGILPKSASVWSGVVLAAGVAGYFRFYGTGGTSGTSATEKRLDGNIGVTGSDMVLGNTSLVLNATVTIDTFNLEVPTSA